jgi:hypothetical protein
MNLAVMLRAQLQALGEGGSAVLRNLESMIAALTAWGDAEHNDDGTHSDVTAATVGVEGLLSAQRYAASKIYLWDYAADASGVLKGPGLVGAGLIVHVDTTAGGGGAARSIYSIDATGRQPGEIVWFVKMDSNTAPGGTNFSQLAGATRQGFPGFANFTGVFGGNVNIQANRVIPIMYLPRNDHQIGYDGGFPDHPWHIGHP